MGFVKIKKINFKNFSKIYAKKRNLQFEFRVKNLISSFSYLGFSYYNFLNYKSAKYNVNTPKVQKIRKKEVEKTTV